MDITQPEQWTASLNKLHNNVQVTQVNTYMNGIHINDVVARRDQER